MNALNTLNTLNALNTLNISIKKIGLYVIASILSNAFCSKSYVIFCSMAVFILYSIKFGIDLYFKTKTIYNSNICAQKFRSKCINIANRNSIILKEYISIYSNQSLKPVDLKNIFKRIRIYSKFMCDTLKLSKMDTLSLNPQKTSIVCNVFDSITNQRNRTIEKILNTVDNAKKQDVVETWNLIDKRYNSNLSILPVRWMLEEYRNLFKYLSSDTSLNKIFSYDEIRSFESTIDDMYSNVNSISLDLDIDICTDLSELVILLSYVWVGVSIESPIDWVFGTMFNMGLTVLLNRLNRLNRLNKMIESKNGLNVDDSTWNEMQAICC